MPTLADLLSRLRGYFNLGDEANQDYSGPIAQSRITRTPIYDASNVDKWNKSKLGQYNPDTDEILVRPSALQDSPYNRDNPLIPHESAHALYGKAGLYPGAVLATSGIPPEVNWQVDLTGSPFNPHPTAEQRMIRKRRDASESVAYSIGNPKATDFIEKVADQIQDPKIAEQLRRLHYNALATQKLP